MRKGFTLIELLVTVVLVSLIMLAVYYTYNNLFKSSKEETLLAESEIEKVIGSEIIRLDIEHAGFGITENETCPVIRWGNVFPLPAGCDDDISTNNNIFIIRSMINNTSINETGWVYVDCTTGNWPSSAPYIVDERLNRSNPKLLFFDSSTGSFVANGNFGTCPGNGVYLAYPYNDISNMDNCIDQVYCHRITYRLSSTQNNDLCNPATRNLLRGIDGTASSGGEPILNCVAGFTVLFDVDIDEDGISDLEYQDYSALDIDNNGIVESTEVMKALKRVHLYFLIQVGKRNPKRIFNQEVLEINEPLTTVSFDLTEIPDYQFYRWRVFKVSVIPMNLRK